MLPLLQWFESKPLKKREHPWGVWFFADFFSAYFNKAFTFIRVVCVLMKHRNLQSIPRTLMDVPMTPMRVLLVNRTTVRVLTSAISVMRTSVHLKTWPLTKTTT